MEALIVYIFVVFMQLDFNLLKLGVAYICVSKPGNIGSDNGLSPVWRHAIIRTSADLLSIGPLGINVNDIIIKIHTFSLKNPFENVISEMSAILSGHQCVNVCNKHLYVYRLSLTTKALNVWCIPMIINAVHAYYVFLCLVTSHFYSNPS